MDQLEQYPDVNDQVAILALNGYTEETIMKIVETAPGIFRFTPEEIRLAFENLGLNFNFKNIPFEENLQEENNFNR